MSIDDDGCTDNNQVCFVQMASGASIRPSLKRIYCIGDEYPHMVSQLDQKLVIFPIGNAHR